MIRDEDRKRSKYWKVLSGLRQAKILPRNYNRRRFNDFIVLVGTLTGRCRLRGHLS